MNGFDYGVIVIYLVVVAAIGLWFARDQDTTRKYFIADGNVPQWVVGFTLMATLISSNTLVAHPAIVYQRGMILVPGFLVMPFVLLVVAFFIVPFYRRVVGMSAYEFIGRRFGVGGRIYTSMGFLLSRTFGIGVTLVTTSIAVKVMTGWEIEPVIIGIGMFTMVYTLIGGLKAVLWTDVVQGLILMGGGLIILGRLLFAPEASTPFEVVSVAWDAGKFNMGSTEASVDSLYQTQDRTIWMFVIAMTISWSRRYICDQAMVQRYLIARSTKEAIRGTLIGATLSVPVLITFNFIGACLFGFYAISGTEAPAIGDHILPHFILNFLPHGFIGLMLAAILAASMSSISSDLNSVATVLSRDYFQRFLPSRSDHAHLNLGRLMVLVAGMFAAWIAISLVPNENSAPLAEKALIITVILSAGMLGLFSLGFLTRSATRRGCYVGIAATVIYTIWGTVTEPSGRVLDLGIYNFEMNSIMIGVFGHVVMFGVGYLASRLLGGYRPEDIEDLVFSFGRIRPAVSPP